MINQSLFSFRDSFSIKDEKDQTVYSCKAKPFTIGKVLDFYDSTGNALFRLKKKIFSFAPTFRIFKNDEVIATVKRDFFTFLKPKYRISMANGDNMEIHGDMFSYEYQILKNEDEVAQISKKFFSFTDTYGVNIKEGNEDSFILALAVVVDLVCHSKKKSKGGFSKRR